MEMQALWIIALVGGGTLAGAFIRMKGGFGTTNLRAIGIVLIALFASVLAIAKTEDVSAALGILGAIAGYLFGTQSSGGASLSTKVGADGSINNSKIAGRDINETINNLQAKVDSLAGFIDGNLSKIELSVQRQHELEYVINNVFERSSVDVYRAMGQVIGRWAAEGYSLISVTENYDRSDAMILVFGRPARRREDVGSVLLYNGVRMEFSGRMDG